MFCFDSFKTLCGPFAIYSIVWQAGSWARPDAIALALAEAASESDAKPEAVAWPHPLALADPDAKPHPLAWAHPLALAEPEAEPLPAAKPHPLAWPHPVAENGFDLDSVSTISVSSIMLGDQRDV